MNDYVAQVPQLPQDAVLLHIGPYKTGTTAVQAALAERRTELAAGGVLYPGRGRNHHRVAWALRGRGTTGMEAVPYREWEVMAEAVGEHPGRVVISSEFFTSITDAQAAELVDRLGAARLHVVMTVRPLMRLLPSDWQERVKTHGFTGTYESWLRDVLAPDRDSPSAELFWRLYGAGGLLRRWLGVLPADQVIVIVADESDRTQTFRVFEALLGLPRGLLRDAGAASGNVSLSLERIELIRQVNEIFEERGWGTKALRRYVHLGMLEKLRGPVAGEAGQRMPALPRWAADRVADLSRERAEVVARSGAVVIGRPADLHLVPDDAPPELPQPPETISIAVATRAIEGVIEAARATTPRRRRTPRPNPTPPDPVKDQPTAALARELGRRVKRRMTGRHRR